MLKDRVPRIIECWIISKLPHELSDAGYILLKSKPCGLKIFPYSLDLFQSATMSVLLALEGVQKLGCAHRDVR